MALDVYNKLDKSTVQEAIAKHPNAYLLGSNGPDILFYFKVFPWEDQEENKRVADYGSLVHENNINLFFNKAVMFIQAMKDQERQAILTSYLAGHLMHWSLDALAHPFVFYRSGEIANDTKYWHFRYESMIDALMVTYYKRKDLASLKAYRLVNVDKEERRVIASFYQMMLLDVFEVKEEAQVIEESISGFKNILHFLYDPHYLVTPILKGLESLMDAEWKFSSHSVNPRIDAQYDVLNLKKELWANPTDLTMTSNDSFIELYEKSIRLGLILLDRMNKILIGDADSFDDIIQDRRYDSGVAMGKVMRHYDSIYEKQ